MCAIAPLRLRASWRGTRLSQHYKDRNYNFHIFDQFPGCLNSIKINHNLHIDRFPGCLNILKMNNFHIFTLTNLGICRRVRGTGAATLATLCSTLCWSWRSTRRRWSTGLTTSTRAMETTRRTMRKKNATVVAPHLLEFSPPLVLGQRKRFSPSRPLW